MTAECIQLILHTKEEYYKGYVQLEKKP